MLSGQRTRNLTVTNVDHQPVPKEFAYDLWFLTGIPDRMQTPYTKSALVDRLRTTIISASKLLDDINQNRVEVIDESAD
jgi:hypothetical protein